MRAFPVIGLLLVLLTEGLLAQGVVTTSASSPATADQRQLERIRQVIQSLGPRTSTPAQLVQLTRDLPPATAAGLYLQIGQDYLCTGNWDLAAAVLLQLLGQYPDEPHVGDATLLLTRLYSSSEVAHSQQRSHDANEKLRLPSGWQKKESTDADQHSDSGMIVYGLYLANDQLQKHPKLAENSPLAFQCAAAARRSGRAQEYRLWLSLLKHKREAGEWRNRSLTESWLEEGRRGQPPLSTAHCRLTEQPPHLDGVLDEPCWQVAGRVNPKSETPHPQSEIFLLFDAEHLYLAARCQKSSDADYSPDDRPRAYDADLSGHDQVRLWLDADRDYATWFELTVDHRGWTGDRCWLNAGWNPKWFVAAAGDEGSWSFEAAIPWAELADRPPRAGEVWAFSAERVPPTGQAEASADAPPADSGLLLFD